MMLKWPATTIRSYARTSICRTRVHHHSQKKEMAKKRKKLHSKTQQLPGANGTTHMAGSGLAGLKDGVHHPHHQAGGNPTVLGTHVAGTPVSREIAAGKVDTTLAGDQYVNDAVEE